MFLLLAALPDIHGCASACLQVKRRSTFTHISCRIKSFAESLISSQYGESNSNSPFRIWANRFASFSS
uniref:Putative secreted peptide n=1 Tax=Anopheles braziliensis TaxID=58242 RepID=A0A2M3ZS12_9DIPT